jgi:hypothetical protein
LCLLKSAWGVLFRPPCFGCFSGNCHSSELNSLDFHISGNLLPLAGSSCMLYLVCVSCFVHKHALKVHSLADMFGHLTVFLRSE